MKIYLFSLLCIPVNVIPLGFLSQLIKQNKAFEVINSAFDKLQQAFSQFLDISWTHSANPPVKEVIDRHEYEHNAVFQPLNNEMSFLCASKFGFRLLTFSSV